jgi:methylated-DNA-[protein]-cysteine S-methyltransferase
MTELEKLLHINSAATERDAAARAASATALRAAADGLADVVYTTVESPFGPLLVASTRRGLVRLAFDLEPYEDVLAGLAARISARIVEAPAFLDPIRRELDEYFAGRRIAFDAPLDWTLIGGFGRRVLRATAAIPYGQTSNYREVATRAGNRAATRAAGNALGRNPIPIVIPCHRVLRTGGALGGYAGGLERKQRLLALESERS